MVKEKSRFETRYGNLMQDLEKFAYENTKNFKIRPINPKRPFSDNIVHFGGFRHIIDGRVLETIRGGNISYKHAPYIDIWIDELYSFPSYDEVKNLDFRGFTEIQNVRNHFGEMIEKRPWKCISQTDISKMHSVFARELVMDFAFSVLKNEDAMYYIGFMIDMYVQYQAQKWKDNIPKIGKFLYIQESDEDFYYVYKKCPVEIININSEVTLSNLKRIKGELK